MCVCARARAFVRAYIHTDALMYIITGAYAYIFILLIANDRLL